MNILIKCKGCKTERMVDRTKEIPDNVKSLGFNWCPDREDKANDYYHEWYVYQRKFKCVSMHKTEQQKLF